MMREFLSDMAIGALCAVGLFVLMFAVIEFLDSPLVDWLQ